MNTSTSTTTIDRPRAKLLKGLPVTEKRIRLRGVSSTVLEGGEGQPVVLLHGPGESSLWWMRVIPSLVESHRVVVPDLPGHGASDADDESLELPGILAWLDELIARTCSSPPALVGHLLGGAIAARFAVDYGDRIDRLVLVDALGLGRFLPAPRFAFNLIRFMVWPREDTYDRFLDECLYNPNSLRAQMGQRWEPFLAYNLERARDADAQAALKTLMRNVGLPKIPAAELERIDVPTGLIWGRHDRAMQLRKARAASDRYGWPLHVIDEARDDPKLEQPDAFLRALYAVLDEPVTL